MRRGTRAWLAIGLLLVQPGRSAAATAAGLCEQAGTEAERAFNLPAGLLVAIGRVESGRWDAERGRVVPWPWAIGTAGAGRLMDSKPEAVSAARATLAAGTRNIDIGCFQVNLMHHPNAFADLEQAFDPAANALYAARFLASLQTRFGNWDDAVAAYHSADPARGIPYRRLVQASWNGSTNRSWASDQPVLRFGIRIWTPSRTGSAPAMIAVGGPAAALPALPRVIVPGR